VIRDFGGWFAALFTVPVRGGWRLVASSVVVLPLVAVVVVGVARMAVQPDPGFDRVLVELGWTVSGAEDLRVPLVVAAGALLALGIGVLSLVTGFQLLTRRAAGLPVTLASSARFAAERALPLLGHLLVLLVPVLALVGLLVAAAVSAGTWLLWLVVPLAWVATLVAGLVAQSALVGVVLVERGGPVRALRLLRGRFWPTFARYVLFGGLCWAYCLGAELVVFTPVALSAASRQPASPGVAAICTVLVLAVPLLAAQTSFSLVSYAALRGAEDPSTTAASLAAEISAR
jgi:hypothetical protein